MRRLRVTTVKKPIDTRRGQSVLAVKTTGHIEGVRHYLVHYERLSPFRLSLDNIIPNRFMGWREKNQPTSIL